MKEKEVSVGTEGSYLESRASSPQQLPSERSLGPFYTVITTNSQVPRGTVSTYHPHLSVTPWLALRCSPTKHLSQSGLHGDSARLFWSSSLWSFKTNPRSLGPGRQLGGCQASSAAKDQATKWRGSQDAPLTHC